MFWREKKISPAVTVKSLMPESEAGQADPSFDIELSLRSLLVSAAVQKTLLGGEPTEQTISMLLEMNNGEDLEMIRQVAIVVEHASQFIFAQPPSARVHVSQDLTDFLTTHKGHGRALVDDVVRAIQTEV